MNKMEKMIEKVINTIRSAGGELIGRTRLQKIVYLQALAEEENYFHFDYYHYGPYSEELSHAVSIAQALEKIEEKEYPTSWGGFYSKYRILEENNPSNSNPMVQLAAKADAVALELAATAAYFASHGYQRPWEETKRRKPDKADSKHLQLAQELYAKLKKVEQRLPDCTE